MKKTNKTNSIYFIDDHSQAALSLKTIITEANLSAFLTENPDNLELELSPIHYSSILAPIADPKRKSSSVLEKLKQTNDKETPIPPILLYGTPPETNSIASAFENGAADILSPPYQPDEVLARIQNATRRHNCKRGNQNALLEGFFSKMAHDLRNQVGCCISLFSMLEPKIAKNTSQIQLSRTIKSELHDTFYIMDNFFSWSKTLIDNDAIKPSNISANEILNLVTKTWDYDFEHMNLNLTIDLEDDFTIYADRSKIIILLRNLVGYLLRFAMPNEIFHISANNTASEKQIHFTLKTEETKIDQFHDSIDTIKHGKIPDLKKIAPLDLGIILNHYIAILHRANISINISKNNNCSCTLSIPNEL